MKNIITTHKASETTTRLDGRELNDDHYDDYNQISTEFQVEFFDNEFCTENSVFFLFEHSFYELAFQRRWLKRSLNYVWCIHDTGIG